MLLIYDRWLGQNAFRVCCSPSDHCPFNKNQVNSWERHANHRFRSRVGAWEWTRALWGGRLTRNAKRWRKSVFCCFRCCRYCDCVCQYVLLVEWLSQQTRTSSLTMSTWLCQDISSHYGHTNILIHPSVVLTTRHGVLRRALTLLLYALFSAVLNRICFSTLLS